MIRDWSSVTVVLVFLSEHFQGWCALNERQQNKARIEIQWVMQIYLHKRKIIRLNAILTKDWITHAWNKASAFTCYCCLNQVFPHLVFQAEVFFENGFISSRNVNTVDCRWLWVRIVWALGIFAYLFTFEGFLYTCSIWILENLKLAGKLFLNSVSKTET